MNSIISIVFLALMSEASVFGAAINDITTTFPNSPAIYSENGAAINYSADIFEIQKEKYPDLKPLFCPKNKSHCFSDCLRLAQRESGWKILSATGENQIRAIAVTSFFKFKDDITIEVRSEENEKVFVHMRSKSRKGKSDLGANAKRIKKYFSDLSELWGSEK